MKFWFRFTQLLLPVCGGLMLMSVLIGRGLPLNVVAYLSETPDLNQRIHLLDFDRRLDGILTEQPALNCCLSWSPDGTKLAFISTARNEYQLYTVDADGGNLHQWTTRSSQGILQLAWSPDGTRIAYIGFLSGTPNDGMVGVVDVTSGETQTLDQIHSSNFPLSWSPDGEQVIYAAEKDNNDRYEVYAIASDGGEPRQIVSNGYLDSSAAVSPDGVHLAYVCSIELCLADMSSGYSWIMTVNNALEAAPAWSPDGERILYWSNRNGDADLYIINRDGSGEQRLTFASGNDWSPSWSPDGRFILFSSARTGDDDIYLIDVACADMPEGCQGKERRLAASTSRDTFPVWQPPRKP